MPITKEELVAALDNSETATLVLDTLKEKEYQVIPKKEHDTFISNLRQSVEDKIAAAKTSEIYNALDKDIFEATGIKKEPNEKTYDYNKRAYAEFNAKISDYQKSIDELKQKIADGSQDKTLKAQLEALQTKQAEYEKTIQEKESLLSQKDMDYRFDTSFERELRQLKINNTIDEDLRNTKIEVTKQKLKASAKIENGNIVFSDENGKVLLDDKGNIATLGSILATQLKPIIDAGIYQTGSGSQNPRIITGQGGFIRLSVLPGDIKTKTQLDKHFSAVGYKRGSKEWDEDYAKFSKGLPLQ